MTYSFDPGVSIKDGDGMLIMRAAIEYYPGLEPIEDIN